VVTGMPSGMFNVPVSVHDAFTGQPGNLLPSTNVHVNGHSLIVAKQSIFLRAFDTSSLVPEEIF